MTYVVRGAATLTADVGGRRLELERFMFPTILAMRRPVTTLMLVVALISGGMLAYDRMRVDIFPSLNTPKIYVFLDYIGMSPDQMEGFIVNQLELYFQYVDGIEDIKTRNIQQVALCELSFFPGTDMGQAMAQVVAMSDRAMSWMPKGTLPPMIMRMDAGSVPVGYLVFESDEDLAGGDGRPGAEHHPAAGAEERARARWRSLRSGRTCGRSS